MEFDIFSWIFCNKFNGLNLIFTLKISYFIFFVLAHVGFQRTRCWQSQIVCPPKCIVLNGRPKMANNVLKLPEGRDFEAIYFQLTTNVDRCAEHTLTSESSLLGSCFYVRDNIYLR